MILVFDWLKFVSFLPPLLSFPPKFITVFIFKQRNPFPDAISTMLQFHKSEKLSSIARRQGNPFVDENIIPNQMEYNFSQTDCSIWKNVMQRNVPRMDQYRDPFHPFLHLLHTHKKEPPTNVFVIWKWWMLHFKLFTEIKVVRNVKSSWAWRCANTWLRKCLVN